MEKISRILPPSARTQSYDSSRALPVRPGAPTAGRPSTGRPENLDAVEDRMTISDRLVAPIENGDTMPSPSSSSNLSDVYKPKDVVKTQMIKEMTNKFFGQDLRAGAKPSGELQTEELAKSQVSAGSMVKPESSSELTR